MYDDGTHHQSLFIEIVVSVGHVSVEPFGSTGWGYTSTFPSLLFLFTSTSDHILAPQCIQQNRHKHTFQRNGVGILGDRDAAC